MSRRKPRKYRFLGPIFSLSLPALFILWGLSRRTGRACDYLHKFAPTADCNFDLGYIPYLLFGMILIGVVASLYRLYRDYYLGEILY